MPQCGKIVAFIFADYTNNSATCGTANLQSTNNVLTFCLKKEPNNKKIKQATEQRGGIREKARINPAGFAQEL